jgi:hypothetical protein
MKRKFPPSREDGSFCVIVKFETAQEATTLQSQINEWCTQWVAENNDLSPENVVLGDIVVQPFNYFYAYAKPPYVIKAEGRQLWLRFDGMPGSYWWRDWLARSMGNLTRTFPELQPENKLSYDCDE